MPPTRPHSSNIIDLMERRRDSAINRYRKALDGIVAGEAAFFAAEKFTPFARSYIASGFSPALQPSIELTVRFRDDRPAPAAHLLITELRRDGFSYAPGMKWAKGTRPKTNPDGDPRGPELTIPIDLREARTFFAGRASSPFGAYQRSTLGFRTAHVRVWDARGIGFSILAGGHDDRRADAPGTAMQRNGTQDAARRHDGIADAAMRRGDTQGVAARAEYHIIDDERDMAEIGHMMALIERSGFTSL